VISRLDVSPGTVSRSGTAVYGEILDLRELDVRCDVTPAQAGVVLVGQTVDVQDEPGTGARWTWRVAMVGGRGDGIYIDSRATAYIDQYTANNAIYNDDPDGSQGQQIDGPYILFPNC
jgi:hypothetical protein